MNHDRDLEEGDELRLDFDKHGGLLPVVVQDAESSQVLMVAWSNSEAFAETLRSRLATFWSTSRRALWKKGLTSGDTLRVVQILVDCDQDALVYRVVREGGGVCHTLDPASGKHRDSCFYRQLDWETGKLQRIDSSRR